MKKLYERFTGWLKKFFGITPRQKDIEIPKMQLPAPVIPPKRKKPKLPPSLFYGKRRHKKANDERRRLKKLKPKSRAWSPVPGSKCPKPKKATSQRRST